MVQSVQPRKDETEVVAFSYSHAYGRISSGYFWRSFEETLKPEKQKVDEARIDAASAVSGCGPAFVYLFIEALADGGVECGLPRAQALELAAQTALGAAEMVLATGRHPGDLKDAVCSPGGTTIAGVHALEDGAFRATAMGAVTAAYERTLELKK